MWSYGISVVSIVVVVLPAMLCLSTSANQSSRSLRLIDPLPRPTSEFGARHKLRCDSCDVRAPRLIPSVRPRDEVLLGLCRWVRESARSYVFVNTLNLLVRPSKSSFASFLPHAPCSARPISPLVEKLSREVFSTRISISLTTHILLLASVAITGQKMGMEAAMMAMLTSRTEKIYMVGV